MDGSEKTLENKYSSKSYELKFLETVYLIFSQDPLTTRKMIENGVKERIENETKNSECRSGAD